MKCPKCGNNNTAGARFCGVCGNKITYNRFCPDCGSPLEPGTPFCGGCGKKLSTQPQSVQGNQNTIQNGLNELDMAAKAAGEGLQSAIDSIKQTTSKSISNLKGLVSKNTQSNSVSSVTPNPPNAKFCPKCGYPLNDGSTFCSVCKEDISILPSAPPISHKPTVKKGIIHNRFNCPSCGIELKVKKKEERLFCSGCHSEIVKDGESYRLVPPKEKKNTSPLPILISCGALVGLSLLCLIIAGIGNAFSSDNIRTTSTYVEKSANIPTDEESLIAKGPVKDEEPSIAPTETPTPPPTGTPTPEPTATPTPEPTATPTPEPTNTPTPVPTNTPTPIPTATPIPQPTATPIPTPTSVPVAPAAEAKTYVLNTDSLKFHKPNCRTIKNLLSEHRLDYTGTYQDVINMGYIPCKVCNPY